jgi:hypothetical protein
MKLFDVGAEGDGAPASFIARRSVTWPTSLKIVETPSTTVMTSEFSVEPKFPGSAPEAACRLLTIRYDDPVPCRVTSPQPLLRIASVRAVAKPVARTTPPPHTALPLTSFEIDSRVIRL